MGLGKFVCFELGLVLLVCFASSVIGVFGFDYFDPKFDLWGNIGFRMFLSTVCSVSVIGAIALTLYVKKSLPVSPKMAALFAIIFGIYLEVFRAMVDRYGWSNGATWLPIFGQILLPVILGVFFFLNVRKV